MPSKPSPPAEVTKPMPNSSVDVLKQAGLSYFELSPADPNSGLITPVKSDASSRMTRESSGIWKLSRPMEPTTTTFHFPDKEDVVIPMAPMEQVSLTEEAKPKKFNCCSADLLLNSRVGAILVGLMTLFIGAIVAVAVYFLANIPSSSGQQATFQTNLRNFCLQQAQQINIQVSQLAASMTDLAAYTELQPVEQDPTSFYIFANRSSITKTPVFSVSYCQRVTQSQRAAWEQEFGPIVVVGMTSTSRAVEPLYYPITYRWVPARFAASGTFNLTGNDYIASVSSAFPASRAIATHELSMSSISYAISLNNSRALVMVVPIVSLNGSPSRVLVNVTLVPPLPNAQTVSNQTWLPFYDDPSVFALLSGAFLTETLFKDTLDRTKNPGVRVVITDASSTEGHGVTIFDYNNQNVSYAMDQSVHMDVPVQDRLWAYTCIPTAAYYSSVQVSTTAIIIVVVSMSAGFVLIALLLAFLVGRYLAKRRKSQLAVQSAMERLQQNSSAILRAISDPIMALDVNTGRIVACNQATLDALGYTVEEIAVKSATEVFLPATEVVTNVTVDVPQVSQARIAVPFLPDSRNRTRTTTPPEMASIGLHLPRIVAPDPVLYSEPVTLANVPDMPKSWSTSHGQLPQPPFNLDSTKMDEVRRPDSTPPIDGPPNKLVPVLILRKDGSTFPAEATWSNDLFLGDTSDATTIVLFRDVTEKHAKEVALAEAVARAQKAEHRTENVLRFLGHELKNPLHAILLAAEDMLRLPNEHSTKTQRSLLEIYSSALYKNELIVNVLDFIDLEHGQLRLSTANLYPVAHVDLISHCDPPLEGLEAWGDAERVAQCLANSIDFAVGCVLATGQRDCVHVHAKFEQASTDANFWSTEQGRGSLVVDITTTGSRVLAEMLGHQRTPTGESQKTLETPLDPTVLHRSFLTDTDIDPFAEHLSSTGSGFGAHGLSLVVATRLASLMGGSLLVETVEEANVGRVEFTVVLRLPLLLNQNSQTLNDVERHASGDTVAEPLPLANVNPWSDAVMERVAHIGLPTDDSSVEGSAKDTDTADRHRKSRARRGRSSLIPTNPTPISCQETKCEILVVEDNMLINRLTTKMLQRNGFAVSSAEDGQVCVDLVKKGNHYDLILMDLHMPRMGGLEAAKNLRSLGFANPIIAVTAYDTIQDREACLKDDIMQDFVSKPAVEADMIRLIQTWIRKKE